MRIFALTLFLFGLFGLAPPANVRVSQEPSADQRSQDDLQAAVDRQRTEAEDGAAGAQFHLGLRYLHGTVVPKDLKQTAKWFRLAADQGHVDCQLFLGAMYANGAGVYRSYREAVKWYRAAADQGERDAQLRLGSLCAQGLGVPQDFLQAYIWYSLAAVEGASKAVSRRNAIADLLTTEQIAEAQEFTRKWKPKKVDVPRQGLPLLIGRRSTLLFIEISGREGE